MTLTVTTLLIQEEIRWYLAAKDQLVDFYIGESALDDASHLYPTNPDDRDGQTYWHYTTSTAYDGGQGGNNVAWGLYAEECVALGAIQWHGKARVRQQIHLPLRAQPRHRP